VKSAAKEKTAEEISRKIIRKKKIIKTTRISIISRPQNLKIRREVFFYCWCRIYKLYAAQFTFTPEAHGPKHHLSITLPPGPGL
jgi:hypothetical protein